MNNGVALHLEGVQRKRDAGVIVSVTARGMRMVESVFVKIQVCITADARDMGREVGGSFPSLQHVSSCLTSLRTNTRTSRHCVSYCPDWIGPGQQVGTYSSLINASLAMMPCNIPKLVLCVGSVGRNWHRLRNEVRKRGLAVLDGYSVGLRSDLFVLALL